MKRIILYLKNYRIKAMMAPLFKCLEAIFELLVPMAVASMIDMGIGRGDNAYIIRMGAVLLLLAAVGVISSLTAQWFAARTAAIAATGLRYDLLRHILSFSCSDIDLHGTDKLMTSMVSDINQVQTGINMFLRLFMRSPFVVFGAAIMAYRIDRRMSIVFFITILILSVLVFGILLGTVPFYRKVQTYKDKLNGLAKEQISGARVIRAFNQEEQIREEFEGESRLLTGMQIFASRISALMNPASVFILNLAIVMLIWKGAFYIELGSMTKGGLVALINYMGQILVELIKFANLIILVSKAIASDRRIEEVFGYTASEDSPESLYDKESCNRKMLISLENVYFTYPASGEPSLEHIQLDIRQGEHIGLIGGTGSGKSTLAKLITGLYPPTEGSIKYAGITDMCSGILNRLVSIAPQKAVMLEGSIYENLCMGRNVDEELLKRALRISQAEEFVYAFEDGLMHHIEQGGRNLSGGQRQRLGIARAICMDTPVLILDDPASALDFATERALRKELFSYAEERELTLIIISQRAAMVRGMSKIAVLNDGIIEATGSHEELYANNELYREICLSQQKNGEVGCV